jgi:hypothetical protein
MYLLRRDCGPSDPTESSLEKIVFAGWALFQIKGLSMMKLSCEQWCHMQEMLARLKCLNFLSAKVKICREENKE